MGHVVSMREVINAYEVVVGQSEGKSPLGRPRRKKEHIKLGLKIIGWEDVGWIQLDRCRVLVIQTFISFICKSVIIYTRDS